MASNRREELWERDGGKLWSTYGGLEKQWWETVKGLSRTDARLEASAGNFRGCNLDPVAQPGMGLGRRSVAEKVKRCKELAEKEFMFPQNANFVGRKIELLELELLLFGDIESNEKDDRCIEITTDDKRRRDSTALRSSTISNVAMRDTLAKEYEERMSRARSR